MLWRSCLPRGAAFSGPAAVASSASGFCLVARWFACGALVAAAIWLPMLAAQHDAAGVAQSTTRLRKSSASPAQAERQARGNEAPQQSTACAPNQPRVPRGAHGAHQAGFCGLKRAGADGPAIGDAAHAGSLCGGDRLRAQPHRRGRGGGLSGAGPRVPARQALCRRGNGAGAGAARRWGTGRLRGFSRRRGKPRGGRRCGRGKDPARIYRSLSRQHLRRPGARAGGQRSAGHGKSDRSAPGAGSSRRHCSGEPAWFPACRGRRWSWRWASSRLRRRPSSSCCWAIR